MSKITCRSCPFLDGITEEATEAQNLACLPSAKDLKILCETFDLSWRCHNNDSIECRGFTDSGLKGNFPLSYSSWYHLVSDNITSDETLEKIKRFYGQLE